MNVAISVASAVNVSDLISDRYASAFVVIVFTPLKYASTLNVSVGLPFMEGHTEAKNAVALAIMILILLFRPQGIFGEKERVS